VVAALWLGCATVLAGCGASQTADPVARAADVTAQVPGYRLRATTTVSTGAGLIKTTMSGVVDRAHRTGVLSAHESALGHSLPTFTEKFSGLTFYMQASGVPALRRLTGGKPWLRFDVNRLLGAIGVGSLPTTGSDPSQFVDYLRAVSTDTKRVGTARVGKAKTTQYHAIIDLRRYPDVLPPARRAAAARSISTLESALGGHTLPVDAWIDSRRMVRRISMEFPECVASQHLRFAMTMDLFDYGPQPRTTLPAAGQAFDITPLLRSAMSKLKFGCGSG
jgi:hypothetical protein